MTERVLLVVDVQNDFCPGGALPVDRGNEVVPVINDMIERVDYSAVVFSRDWHPANSEHFSRWPAHCVQYTEGALLHRALKISLNPRSFVLDKGVTGDGYSMFDGTLAYMLGLDAFLNEQQSVVGLDVVGLATDYCVKATVLDALRRGWGNVNVVLSACRAVNLKPGDEHRALDEMSGEGANIIWSVL